MPKDEAAASEVVGALMLILIVVGAAASFAVFVQKEQAEVQENRALQNRRDNERMEVVAATFNVSETSHRLISNVSLLLQNQWTEDSVVDGLSVGVNFMRAGNLSYTRAGGSPVLYNFSADHGCPVSPSTLSQRDAHVVRQGSDLASATCVLTDTSDFVGWGSPDILLVDALDRIHLSRGERVEVSFNVTNAEEAYIVERLHEHLERFHLLRIPDRIAVYRLAATGGNIEALAEMAGLAPGKGAIHLPVATLRGLIGQLEQTSPEQRMQRWGFRPDRADVILPAALVYARVAELFGADAICVPGVGVKEGLLLDLMDERLDPDGRSKRLQRNVEDSAYGLGRAFHFEEDHHQQVARLALAMFDDLKPLHGLGPKSRRVLHAASLLHDIGKTVGHAKHHKHSAYIIENAQLPGLTKKQARMAAVVARYHRKALPKPDHRIYRDLDDGDRLRVDRLAAILRIADALDKRHAQSVSHLICGYRGGQVELRIQGGGPFHLQRWAVDKKSDLFELVFGMRPRLVVESVVEVGA